MLADIKTMMKVGAPVALLLFLFSAAGWVGLRPPDMLAGNSEMPLPPAPLFTEAERKAVNEYWNAPGRYELKPSATEPERVNITVAGSLWYTEFLKAQRDGGRDTRGWDQWFTTKFRYERALLVSGGDAMEPGDMPPALKDTIGAPPALFEMVQPYHYTVTFAPEDAPAPFEYTDATPFGTRSYYVRFYRATNGVAKVGKTVRSYNTDEKKQLDAVFRKIGGSEYERHVLQAVSALEGGFEAINTYDTGFVSIGFIQFTTGENGTGSLSSVLLRHKNDDPKDFQANFRRFGLDVASDPAPTIVAVDPSSGIELRGPDAVRAIINDKRLTAVFERAGSTEAFRKAQVRVARSQYWPGDDSFPVPIATLYEQGSGNDKPRKLGTFYGRAESHPKVAAALAAATAKKQKDASYRVWLDTETETARVSDFVKSEAGMATLMDRKVNRGNIRDIGGIVTDVLRAYPREGRDELPLLERPIIEAMKYRADFLADSSLSQPPPLPKTPTIPAATAEKNRDTTAPSPASPPAKRGETTPGAKTGTLRRR